MRSSVVGHVMVSDNVSEVDLRSGHDLVVVVIDGMVPSDDIAKAETECVVTVTLDYKIFNVSSLWLEFLKFAPFTDLWVCDHDDIMVCVVLLVLGYDKVIALYAVLQLFEEALGSLESL